jgi:hypothetical protein
MAIDDSNALEYFLERAAIMEFDAGLKRYAAESYAEVAVWRFCQRTGYAQPETPSYRMIRAHLNWDSPREPSESPATVMTSTMYKDR